MIRPNQLTGLLIIIVFTRMALHHSWVALAMQHFAIQSVACCQSMSFQGPRTLLFNKFWQWVGVSMPWAIFHSLLWKHLKGPPPPDLFGRLVRCSVHGYSFLRLQCMSLSLRHHLGRLNLSCLNHTPLGTYKSEVPWHY